MGGDLNKRFSKGSSNFCKKFPKRCYSEKLFGMKKRDGLKVQLISLQREKKESIKEEKQIRLGGEKRTGISFKKMIPQGAVKG